MKTFTHKFNWTLTDNPSLAILSMENHFLHLEHRIGQVSYTTIGFVDKFVDFLNEVKKKYEFTNDYLQIRYVWFNDKGGDYSVNVDYLISIGNEQKITPEQLQQAFEEYNDSVYYNSVQIDLKIRENIITSSDHFHANHREYYGFKG